MLKVGYAKGEWFYTWLNQDVHSLAKPSLGHAPKLKKGPGGDSRGLQEDHQGAIRR